MEKGRQFAIFTENQSVLASIEGVCGLYNNQMGKPQKALEYLEKTLQISKGVASFAYAEMAKSHYMMDNYLQALDCLKKVKYPTHTPFKYDYLHIWSAKVYEGLCLYKLNKTLEGEAAIKAGIEKLEIAGVSKALAFAYKSLSEVYSSSGNFEAAFAALKKSNEIEDLAKENRLYY